MQKRATMILMGVLLLSLAVDAEEHHVEQGQSVTLMCNTTIRSDVIWLFQHSLIDSYVYIYSNDKVYESYRTRFKVVGNDTAGQYRLTISDVQLSDNGIYTCKEDGGFGDSHMFHVNVSSKHSTVVLNNVTSKPDNESGDAAPQPDQTMLKTLVIVVVAVFAIVIVVVIAIVLYIFVVRKQRCTGGTDNRDTSSAGGKSAKIAAANDDPENKSSQRLLHSPPQTTHHKTKMLYISHHRAEISRLISFDGKLLQLMKEKDDFNDVDEREITAAGSQERMVDELLEKLRSERPKLDYFISCLKDDGQSVLANSFATWARSDEVESPPRHSMK